ncbi:MAG: bepF 1 [Rhizobium sp.]|nr:bepF 1 [Rhizobium sp.]
MKSLFLLLLPLSILLAGCEGEEKTPLQVRPVKTTDVTREQSSVVSFVGTVEPQVTTNYGFEIFGRMISRSVQVGDLVKTGTVLARLDSVTLLEDVRAAKASLASAEASLSKARTDEARQKSLYTSQAVAKVKVDDAVRANAATLAAKLEAEASLAKAKERLTYAQLVCAYDGIITAISAEPGQVVAQSQTVVTVANPDLRDAVVDLPQTVAATLNIGTPVEIALQLDPKQILTGRVRRIEPAADAATRTQRIRIALGDAPPSFRLGSVVSVRLPDQHVSELSIPAMAVLERQGKTIVWSIAEDSKAVRARQIDVQRRPDGNWSVISGLKVGERIVTAGVHNLSDGQRVTILGEQK